MIGFRLAVGFAIVVGFTGCGSDQDATATLVMPDVVGLQLDVALSDIKRAGFEDEVEVLSDGVFGVVDESNWQVCEQLPAAGEAVTETPRLTVDRSCPDSDRESAPVDSEPVVTEPVATEPAPVDSAPAVTEPSEEVAVEASYAYEGPEYQVVSTDSTGIELDQFWVLTDKLDYSTDAYKDQVKAIIADIARDQGTASIIVEVVTDIEIARAESESLRVAFEAEVGADYVQNVVLPKEATDWIGSYRGGYDAALDELSESAEAFEVIWFVGGDSPEFETWKPE